MVRAEGLRAGLYGAVLSFSFSRSISDQRVHPSTHPSSTDPDVAHSRVSVAVAGARIRHTRTRTRAHPAERLVDGSQRGMQQRRRIGRSRAGHAVDDGRAAHGHQALQRQEEGWGGKEEKHVRKQ